MPRCARWPPAPPRPCRWRRVTNLARALKLLKEAGQWIVGADMAGEQLAWQADLAGSKALVMGGEGDGLRELTRKSCDFLVRLPQLGAVESMNVSVACGMLLYEAVRQRGANSSAREADQADEQRQLSAPPAARRSSRPPPHRWGSAGPAPRASRRSAAPSGTRIQRQHRNAAADDHGEAHRVQRVAGRETETVQRPPGAHDGGVRDVGAFAHQHVLQARGRWPARRRRRSRTAARCAGLRRRR